MIMIDLSFVLPICFLPDAKNAYQQAAILDSIHV